MKRFTWHQLLCDAYARGQNLAHLAIGRMMDWVEEATGKWPDWDDIAPEWAVELMGH